MSTESRDFLGYDQIIDFVDGVSFGPIPEGDRALSIYRGTV